MSKKMSRISINKLESTMRNNVITVPMERYPDIEITIRYALPLQEVLQFVEDVVSSCIDEETGRYIPEVRSFTIRASVLTRYANFTLPKDPEKQYDLIYNTDAFQQVMDAIDRTQYDEVLYAIDERIRHNVAMMESTVASQMADLITKINAFISGSEELFGSIESEDMSALVKNLSNAGSIDEGKLAKAVLDAEQQQKTHAMDDSVVVSDGNIVTLRKKRTDDNA